MRLPNEAQLSQEQKEICFAPTHETILVSGPPGSGKTVVAVFRDKTLESQGQTVTTVVFNRVLKQFTDLDKTFHSWLSSWWRKCTNRPFPYYIENRRRLNDYPSALKYLRENASNFSARGHWGHLILDEAQDFPPDAHALLSSVRYSVFGDLEEKDKPHLTVLGDENQRLEKGKNATIEQIRDAYLIGPKKEYKLENNYRNTREIAELAAHFYAGLPSGIPNLPERRGERPELITTSDLNEAVDKICDHVRLHENEEVGVFVFYHRTRKRILNKLTHRLQSSNATIRSYTSDQNDPNHDETKLIFDKPGSVTVLCMASAKGLEFDTVFLPELQTFPIDGGNDMETKMHLYVMISRARSRLYLMLTDPERSSELWKLLPQPPILKVP